MHVWGSVYSHLLRFAFNLIIWIQIIIQSKPRFHSYLKYHQSFEGDALVVWLWGSQTSKNLREIHIDILRTAKELNQQLSAKAKEQFEIRNSQYRCRANNIFKIFIRLENKSMTSTCRYFFPQNKCNIYCI